MMRFLPLVCSRYFVLFALSLLAIEVVSAREGIDWEVLSSTDGGLPMPPGSNQQTTCVLGDIDGDGDEDIFITDRSISPSIVLLLRGEGGWTRCVVETDTLRIEAGGVTGDVDRDGDLDLILGQDSSGGQLWWFENPFIPSGAISPDVDWVRRTIKNSGTQQHDQAFGDFDNDGESEVASWVNRSNRVEIYGLPATADGSFPLEATLSGMGGEGMSACDVDGDGVIDILAGGHWLRHEESGNYGRSVIDAGYASGSMVGGQFIPGGYAEVVISSADSVGPVNFYAYNGSSWNETTLIASADHGHSLGQGDIDGDGYLDIFVAEMGSPGAGANCKAWICWGDGAGSFEVETISTGTGNHMSRLGDLDGDGDLDIVMKPYSYDAPRVDVYLNNRTEPPVHEIDEWETHLIDDLPSRAIFVGAADLDGDTLPDLVAGGYWWRNPGALDGEWQRSSIGSPLNNYAAQGDLDGDGDVDLIGTQGVGSASNHRFAWAENTGGEFTVRELGGAGGDFLQGVALIHTSDGQRRLFLSWHAGGDGLHSISIPEDPVNETWFANYVNLLTEEEDLSAGDIDNDGDTDLAMGRYWLEQVDSEWTVRDTRIEYEAFPDRNDLADIDGDGDLDLVVGLEEGTVISWAENPRLPSGSALGSWTRHTIGISAGQGFSMDTRDADNDGDPDVVVGEHRGSGVNRVLLFVNDGSAENWPVQVIDSQATSVIDHHDGTQFHDMDNDGDLDIISIGWNNQKLWIFENTFEPGTVQTAALPIFSPSGGSFVGSVSVAISSATGGAEIRYTLDGSEPTAFSTLYTGALLLNEDTVIRARAFRAGYQASAVASAAYEIQPDVTPPEIVSVSAMGDATRVRVVFDETLETASARTASNYQIYPDISVSSVQLVTDAQSVLLTTALLQPEVIYTLTVNNVRDNADPANVIAVNTTRTFQYVPLRIEAHWLFDGGTGTEASDASGNGHDAALHGPGWIEGKAGEGLSFDGVNDYVDAGTFNVTGEVLTLTAWIKADTFSHLNSRDARIITKSTGTAEQDHYWMLSSISSGSATRARFRLKTGGTTGTLIADSGDLVADQWIHLAAVYDGAYMILYRNGVEVGRTAKTGSIDQGSAPVWIGDSPPSSGTRPFSGSIDDVRIYAEALTRDQVRDIMFEGVEPPDPYHAWLSQQFDAEVLDNPALEATVWGAQADPDDDGLANQWEYYFDRLPRNAESEPIFRVEVTSEMATIHFTSAPLDFQFLPVIQSSSNLQTWTTRSESIGHDDDSNQRSITILSPHYPLFLRLHLEE